jgi:hypothetical protein
MADERKCGGTVINLQSSDDSDGVPLASENKWLAGFERESKLTISTVGRKTGRKHTVSIWFAVNKNGRLLIATQDRRRDWVKNALKAGAVDVAIGSVMRRMLIIPLEDQAEIQEVNDLYAKKYLLGRIGQLFAPFTRKRFAHSGAFELKPL